MRLNSAAVRTLYEQNGWSQNELARCVNVEHGSLSNALSGRRGAGRKVLSGLLSVFPYESAASLTKEIGDNPSVAERGRAK